MVSGSALRAGPRLPWPMPRVQQDSAADSTWAMKVTVYRPELLVPKERRQLAAVAQQPRGQPVGVRLAPGAGGGGQGVEPVLDAAGPPRVGRVVRLVPPLLQGQHVLGRTGRRRRWG